MDTAELTELDRLLVARLADASNKHTRTETEMRDALARFCRAAWEPTAHVPIFSIPPQSNDADMILADAIDELVMLRAQVRG